MTPMEGRGLLRGVVLLLALSLARLLVSVTGDPAPLSEGLGDELPRGGEHDRAVTLEGHFRSRRAPPLRPHAPDLTKPETGLAPALLGAAPGPLAASRLIGGVWPNHGGPYSQRG